jgi:hypothetical protein
MAKYGCGCSNSHDSLSRPVNLGEPERYASAIAGGFLLGVGIMSTSTWPRLGAMLLGGSLIYRGVSGHCMLYHMLSKSRKQAKRVEQTEAQVDEAIEESFPASDPPAFTASAASRSRE